MLTYFIADLHLNQDQPHITAGFLRFLKHDAIHADALYILGDFFDVWVGDDDPNPLHATIAQALKKLNQHGVACYFIQGNRDFMLGKKFARLCHMKLLPPEWVIKLYGQRVLILHGDTLCTDDHSYQRYRRYMHNPFLQKLFLLLPLRYRAKIGDKIRNKSRQRNKQKSLYVMDVNQQAVINTLTIHKAHLMIHGHTHKAQIHTFELNGRAAQRVVLGDWHKKASILKVSADHSLELLELALENANLP